ncbi:hypothetical protein DICVIV_09460 [Dictyocaulus viviparus]|uniref:RING-CH-type domain-containing protein n=1 Tax=Dictyocaulus viviparus TaxID=29172 RepID=A0A0D8XL06_DICVI|nr:hypothetical protein DICVIV_09460 [Dictyocaulus viviparus]
MGLYHRSCLEHWLSTSHTRCCEICKFRYEIGRRKQGFISYLRANSWFINGDHPRNIGSDCACLLLLTPLTLGGSVLCIQNISDRLRIVDQNGDLEKLHEILGLGLMACFLMIVFFFWILFTAMFYFHDFRIWQKKNLCCGGSTSQRDVIALRDTVIDNVSPELVQTVDNTDSTLYRTQMHQFQPNLSLSPLDFDKSEMKCYLCGTMSTETNVGFQLDTRMIRPCFCEVSCHHKCIASRVRTHPQCKLCGVSYRYRQYGSLWDFFVRYWCQYCFTILILLFFFGISTVVIVKSLKEVEELSATSILLLIVGVTISGLGLSFLWICTKYTTTRRIPRFNNRYQQITVFDYNQFKNIQPKKGVVAREESQTDSLPHITTSQYAINCELSPLWRASSTSVCERDKQAVISFHQPPDSKGLQTI